MFSWWSPPRLPPQRPSRQQSRELRGEEHRALAEQLLYLPSQPRTTEMQAAQPGDRKLAQLRAPEQKLPEVMDGSLWQERSKPQRAPLPPAAVTGLMFLQVPPYPEVFRDSLHTFKLNEQDTDVRAALPPPVSTQPSRGHPHARCPPRGAPSLHLPCWWLFIRLLTSSLTTDNILPTPSSCPSCVSP